MKKSNPRKERYEYLSLRADWYLANQALPTAVRSHLSGKRKLEFVGFPRQWIPIFEWFGIPWSNSIPPQKYIPLFSDLQEQEIIVLVETARRNGALRILVEATSMLDSITSNFLYILDHTASPNSAEMERDLSEFKFERGEKHPKKLLLNGWQSYGRPSIVDLENRILAVKASQNLALILPCSLKRPYWESMTHKKIYKCLEGLGFNLENFHKIVITSLGILPEELWELPQVLAYDAGIPDIYRILRLARGYFKRNHYELVLDCLQFEPYSDILRIMRNEGAIENIQKVQLFASRQFVIPRIR